MQSYVETRNRRASDAASGIDLNREEWRDYNDDDLVRNFEMFQAYDLDSSGFISPENLFDVLKAMEVPDCSMEMVHSIIEETAVLTGHDNDGKLSFRDYMHAIRQDRTAADHNDALDAAAERRLSQAEAEPAVDLEPESESGAAPEPERDEPPVDVKEPEAPVGEARARRGSISALNALASARIKAFQQVVADASAQEKLNAFKTKPEHMSGPMVNSDELHKETLRNKVKAFEVAATFKGKIELKKTWKKVGGAGNYAPGQKILLGGQPAGVAPKKKLSDLP